MEDASNNRKKRNELKRLGDRAQNRNEARMYLEQVRLISFYIRILLANDILDQAQDHALEMIKKQCEARNLVRQK